MIRFFDTFSGKLKDFDVAQGGMVKMYTCGPTVYDYAHIGNFRTYVFEDLLRRFLEFQKFKVQHVMNVTNIDDKTIAGANKDAGAYGNTPLQRLEKFTSRYLEAFNEDLKTLNILSPHKQPHATEEIPAMIELIGKLVRNGKAYASDGSVYYRVSAFPAYGKLSKKDLKGNIRGARVDQDEYEKEEGADFALWKKAKEGEPAWDSPWGKGRPGWHIECSAMSMEYLGDTFDIHAGGEDLIFPHHENEIAQSEGATGKPFVRYWLHAKHLLANGEKMSKSKGNFYTLRDLVAKGYDPMAIRYALLSVHYRQQMNFTLEGLEEAKEAIKKLDDCYWECLNRANTIGIVQDFQTLNMGYHLKAHLNILSEKTIEALDDDLNVSVALARLFAGIKEINGVVSHNVMNEENVQAALDFFAKVDRLFGLNLVSQEKLPENISKMFIERDAVRSNPNFKKTKELQMKSDDFRNRIEQSGWLIKDGRPGMSSIIKKKRRTWD